MMMMMIATIFLLYAYQFYYVLLLHRAWNIKEMCGVEQ